MKKICAILFLSFVIMNFSKAQTQFQAKEVFGAEAEKIFYGADHIWLKQANIVPTFIQFREDKALSETDFLFHLRKQFHLPVNYTFQQIGEEKDQINYTHKRFQLLVNNIAVKDGIFILHIRAGKVIKYNGYLFNRVAVGSTPSIDEAAALRNALNAVHATKYKWEMPEEEAFIKIEQKKSTATYYPKGELTIMQKDGNIASTNFVLCWKFDVYAHAPMGRYNVYVDAITGAIINTENEICTSDAAGTAITVYRGSRPFTTDSTSSTNYRLRETARGLGINTYDLRRGTSYGAAIDFTDSNNVWNNINANKDQYATDAHWGAEKTSDFYTTMGRSSIDGAGYPLNLYVHYSTSYVNAFWDGTKMTFGDGNSTYSPLVSLDITGHEITHGLDQFTAGLTYSYESGALNESFSDIFGNAIEYYADSALASWLIGEDIGAAFRSMSSPNSYSQPDTYLGTLWYTGSADAGGVHTNSGVQNFWYYLLCMGGSGTNDLGNAYSVTALGRAKANNIAWRNLVTYLTSGSQYADARFYAIQSAIDLYGACTPEVVSTTNAWYAVGVGPLYSATVDAQFTNSLSVGCSVPFTVNFTNTSYNADAFTWDFGDGTTSSSISPSHTYTAFGTYTVKLIASGGACGTDSIISAGLVNLSTSNPCVVVLPASGSADVQTSCNGTVYDNGGQYGAYSDLTNSNVTISPAGASTVTLTYSRFRMENTYDFVYIYDGPSTASPLIRSSTGYSLPTTITSSGPSITIRQFTDESVVDTGFAISWTCNILTPIANFRGIDSISCTGTVRFTDLSTRSPTSWRWNFGDGDTSFLQNPTHTYLANGTYTVTLIATNSTGSSTLTKTGYITVNKPAGPTGVSGFRCGAGSVAIGIVPTAGVVNWYATSTGGTSLGTGTTFNTPSISSTTTYYAEVTNAGCVSLRTPITASIRSTSSGSFSTSICSGSAYLFNGVNRTTAGSYLDTLVNVAGCDSFVTLNLSIRSTSVGSFAVSVCYGSSYFFNGISRSGTGSYLDTLPNYVGCDSVVTLHLTVRAASAGSFAIGICSGSTYLFNGVNRSISGTYLDTVANSLGCDSVITLNLSVTPSVSGSLSRSICFGSGFLFNGSLRTATGTYLDTLSSFAGCDSVVSLLLTVRSLSVGSFGINICSGSSYLFNDISRSIAGSYIDTVTNSTGCDSIVTLNLTVSGELSGTLNQSICAGASYLFNGVLRTITGAYADTLTSSTGCDSIVTLDLVVRAPSTGFLSTSICAGASYLYNGVNLTRSGSYLDTLSNSSGCDSTVTLYLTVGAPLTGSFSRAICPGGSYLFNSISRTLAGSYLDTLRTAGGCDSIVTLNLSVLGSCALLNDAICSPINFSSSGVFVETAVWNLGSDNPDCDTLVGNSSAAGIDAGEPVGSAPGAGGSQKTMWYFVGAPSCAANSVRFSTNTEPTNYNTRLTAYHRISSLSCLGPYTELASNDDVGISPLANASTLVLTPGSGTASSATFNPGSPIYVQVSGFNGDAGNYGVIVDIDAPDLTVGTVTSSTASINLSSAIRAYGTLSGVYIRYRRVGDAASTYTQVTLSGAASSYTLSGLSSDVGYDVWAMYRCAAEDRWVSKKVSIHTTPGCTAPLAGPTVSTTGSTCSSVSINWTPSSLATRYIVSWRKVGSTSYSSRTVTAPASSYSTGTVLLSGTAYEFWVTAICSGGAMNTSPITTFVTCGTSLLRKTDDYSAISEGVYAYEDNDFMYLPINAIAQTISALYPNLTEVALSNSNVVEMDKYNSTVTLANQEQIQLNPNPANNDATIRYILPAESSILTIKVTDIQGQVRLHETLYEPSIEGIYSLNLSQIAAGIYFVTIEADNYSQTRKLLISKD